MDKLTSKNRVRRCLGLVAAQLIVCGPVGATARAEPVERSFVIRAGTVLPVTSDGPASLSPGVVIVRDGKISAIGEALPIPPDLPVIDLPDATVMPGLVAASSSLVEPHQGDEAVAAGYQAVDAFLPYGDYRAVLAGGVTTVHLSAGRHRLISGQGAVVKLGGPRDAHLVSRGADLTVNLTRSAYDPPKLIHYQTPSSSDVALPMPNRQRPASRLDAVYALNEALAWSEPHEFAAWHYRALSRMWQAGRTVRVHVQRDPDIAAALDWIARHDRTAYLVGGAECDEAADRLRAADLPLVFELGGGLRGKAKSLGYDPDALERDVLALRAIDGVKLALATVPEAPVVDLRLAAATALRAGLSESSVIEAVTRTPAELLGVSDRVGSLAPGKDADLLVLSGDPLATTTHVRRVYIGGSLAFTPPESDALVVRGGTIWLNEDERIDDGSILIENGKITAVGKTVPHPPFARFIDGGAGSFITPGLIDAHGHLGLSGDESAASPQLKLTRIIGVPDLPERRVARAGVTTVLLAPYRASGQGSQVAAIRTGGRSRAHRVVRETAGVFFDLADVDPAKISEKLKGRFEAGKKYLEKWQKYNKDLEEWKEKRAKGEKIDVKKKEVTEERQVEADPLTGTWSVTLSGGPLPEPQKATMRLRLTGEDVEGRLSVPGAPEEVKVTGTFDGKHLSAVVDIETPQGTPRIEADLVAEDTLSGSLIVAAMEVDFEASRTDKEAVEFKVIKRKTRGKDGRPLPPKVDEALEPLRTILEGKIPALIRVSAPAQVASVIEFMKEWETSFVLLDAEGAREHAEELIEHEAGVIVPEDLIRWERHERYYQADDLRRRGVSVAFQSGSEDAARTLPQLGLYAVERGYGADAALASLTTEPARMFKLDGLIGSLEPGRYGDLVVFSGPPFQTGSYVKRVIVHGEEVR